MAAIDDAPLPPARPPQGWEVHVERYASLGVLGLGALCRCGLWVWGWGQATTLSCSDWGGAGNLCLGGGVGLLRC